MSLPLEGIRIADFSWVVAGPFTTMWLATMGAEVIKVESSTHTDVNRRLPPFADGVPGPERSGLWQGLNVSKRSCTINLTTERGQALALELVKQSDVVVENFSYGQMDRFHLSWDELRAVRPDLIMLSSSGLGRTGPHRRYVTFGPPLTAMTGLSSITGLEGGPPDRQIGGIWSDHLSGLTACFHLLAALEHRRRTGEGQLLEYSMAEVVMSHLPEAYIDYTANGRVWEPQGNADTVFCPHGFFPAAGDDDWVAIAVDDEAAWAGLCAAMQRGDWATDDGLASWQGRQARRGEIEQDLAAWTAAWDGSALVEELQRHGVPAARAANSADLLSDPQLRARGFFLAPDHPETGSRELSGLPWQVSGVDPRITPPPLLGQDNVYVFQELLGLSDLEFAELTAEGVLV